MPEHDQVEVRDAAVRHRYEMLLGGEVVGFADYRREADRVVVTHTEVDHERSGEGLGSRLVGALLDDIRQRGEKVVPLCTFVAQFIQRQREYVDLVDEEHLAQLDGRD